MNFVEASEKLAALATPERLKIMRLLAHGRANVTRILETLDIPAATVSHHLAALRKARLVIGQNEGRFVFYPLAPGILDLNSSNSRHVSLLIEECRLILPHH